MTGTVITVSLVARRFVLSPSVFPLPTTVSYAHSARRRLPASRFRRVTKSSFNLRLLLGAHSCSKIPRGQPDSAAIMIPAATEAFSDVTAPRGSILQS